MFNRIIKAIKQTSIETKVELKESPTFGNFFKITIIDGKKFTFMLNEEDFINFYAQIEVVQNKRVNKLIERTNKNVDIL